MAPINNATPTRIHTPAAAIVQPVSNQETRTCHLCKKKGHLIGNWFDNPHRVMIALGEDDDQDAYADLDLAYISNFICDQYLKTNVFFSPTEIVLDNAAGLDIFMNPRLLVEMQSAPTVRMGGVDANSGDLMISEKG